MLQAEITKAARRFTTPRHTARPDSSAASCRFKATAKGSATFSFFITKLILFGSLKAAIQSWPLVSRSTKPKEMNARRITTKFFSSYSYYKRVDFSLLTKNWVNVSKATFVLDNIL